MRYVFSESAPVDIATSTSFWVDCFGFEDESGKVVWTHLKYEGPNGEDHWVRCTLSRELKDNRPVVDAPEQLIELFVRQALCS